MKKEHTLLTTEQLMKGIKKPKEVIAYPSRKSEGYLTTLFLEIKIGNEDKFTKCLRYLGKLKPNEFQDFLISDYWVNQYISEYKANVKLIKVKYWKLEEELSYEWTVIN